MSIRKFFNSVLDRLIQRYESLYIGFRVKFKKFKLKLGKKKIKPLKPLSKMERVRSSEDGSRVTREVSVRNANVFAGCSAGSVHDIMNKQHHEIQLVDEIINSALDQRHQVKKEDDAELMQYINKTAVQMGSYQEAYKERGIDVIAEITNRARATQAKEVYVDSSTECDSDLLARDFENSLDDLLQKEDQMTSSESDLSESSDDK